MVEKNAVNRKKDLTFLINIFQFLIILKFNKKFSVHHTIPLIEDIMATSN
jgi:hypothetical protein